MQSIQRVNFPKNRFYGLRFSQRPTASVGVKIEFQSQQSLLFNFRIYTRDFFKSRILDPLTLTNFFVHEILKRLSQKWLFLCCKMLYLLVGTRSKIYKNKMIWSLYFHKKFSAKFTKFQHLSWIFSRASKCSLR